MLTRRSKFLFFLFNFLFVRYSVSANEKELSQKSSPTIREAIESTSKPDIDPPPLNSPLKHNYSADFESERHFEQYSVLIRCVSNPL